MVYGAGSHHTLQRTGLLLPESYAIPYRSQLDMLCSRVLPWLDTVDTQKKLSRAVALLDPRWKDSLKVGPYMACGERNHAKKVVRELLAGYDFGRISSSLLREGDDGLLSLCGERDAGDPRDLLEMLNRDDPEEIRAWLRGNFCRNMEQAKFCVKKKEC